MRQTHMCMDLAWRIYPQCAIFSGSVCALYVWGAAPPGRGGKKIKIEEFAKFPHGPKTNARPQCRFSAEVKF